MTDAERAEVAKALREIEQHAREMTSLLDVHGLPLAAAHYGTTIATRLALVDRLVRKP